MHFDLLLEKQLIGRFFHHFLQKIRKRTHMLTMVWYNHNRQNSHQLVVHYFSIPLSNVKFQIFALAFCMFSEVSSVIYPEILESYNEWIAGNGI